MHPRHLLPLLLLAACSGSSSMPGGQDAAPADGGAPDQRQDTDAAPAMDPGTAVVTTTAGFGGGGAINLVRLADNQVTKALDTTLDFDNGVRVFGTKAYVLDRTHGTLRIYDTASWTSPVEVTLEDGTGSPGHGTSNPQDVWATDDGAKVYVSLLGHDSAHALALVDPSTKKVSKWIPIATATADTDGNPDPYTLAGCGGKVFVTLDDLVQWVPSGPGRIAVVDTATDQVVKTIQLQRQNPAAIALEGTDCRKALVAAAGPLRAEPDDTGGIERIDLQAGTSLGVVLGDKALSGRPSAVAVAGPDVAYAVVNYDLQPQASGPPLLSSNKVVAFSPSTGQAGADVLGPAVFIPFVTVSPGGTVLVGINNYAGSMTVGKLASGLYVGRADGKALGTTPIDLGQNPYAAALK